VGQLWALPPLQANRREQQPHFRSLPLHPSYLGATKELAWHSWFAPKEMGGHRPPRMKMFKKLFIINFSVGLSFKINRLSAD
jgi:hypothetical protein